MAKLVDVGRAAELVAECDQAGTVTLTDEHIGAGASSGTGGGGWAAKQLALLGIAWPPPKGWRRGVVGTPMPGKVVAEFIRMRRN